MEVYNPSLKVWALADASLIRWGTGRQVCYPSPISHPTKNRFRKKEGLT